MPEPTARPASDGDPWLTVQQVSEELKLHPATLRRWIKTERLAAVRAGREWRVRRSEVERAVTVPGIESSSILQSEVAGSILTCTLIATKINNRVIYSPVMQ